MPMGRHSLLILTAGALAGLACSAALDGTSPTRLQVTRLRSEPYSYTYISGLTQSERLVVRDNATWQAIWSKLWIGASPKPAPPTIDFFKEMLIVTALGARNTGGYTILVDSATRASDGITIWIRTISPGPKCGTTQALTQPVDLARLPRIDAAVRFTDTAVVADCR